MKLSAITLPFGMIRVALASIELKHNTDGSARAVFYIPDSAQADLDVIAPVITPPPIPAPTSSPNYPLLHARDISAGELKCLEGKGGPSCCKKLDMCYIAFENYKKQGYAHKYCDALTAAVLTDPKDMKGPFASACWKNPKRLSSACSCFPSATPEPVALPEPKYHPKPYEKTKPACGPPGTKCTIDDFVDFCCTNSGGQSGCLFRDGDVNDGVCIH
ncbi:hypothetical protein QBC35DRAFT_456825 [Podospora australis]|uniref:Uncharacterized protein n=1 Tax=Podospora australis TaxID=1536484 RepID=A0AAN6WJQ8_9PEZI|nr:hypothetical protein QBC35DRAFT_456825 [Podospora australis]